ESRAAVEHQDLQAALVGSFRQERLAKMQDLAFELLLDFEAKVIMVDRKAVERIAAAPQQLARIHQRQDFERKDVARRGQVLVVEKQRQRNSFAPLRYSGDLAKQRRGDAAH